MSVATGIAPSELVALDGPMWDALVRATEERWPMELELAAQQVELSSAILGLVARAWFKGPKLKQVTIPRPAPAEDEPQPARRDRPQVVSVMELAALAEKRIEAAA